MAVPLAELHLHLYGTIRSSHYLSYVENREVDWTVYEAEYEKAYGKSATLRQALDRHRSGDPQAADDFHRLFAFLDSDAGNFARFQTRFALLDNGGELANLPSSGEPHPELLDEVRFFVRAMIADQKAQGIAYAEQRFLMGKRFSLTGGRLGMEVVLEEYAELESADFAPRLAISHLRDDPWWLWEETKRLALGPYGRLVTGVDFCNIEEGHPPKDKAQFFQSVKSFNREHPDRALAILYHVGESFEDKSLESAVRWVQEAAELGADRLGHAIALGVDPGNYGDHVRTESVAERLDQIAYDRRHADGLEAHGVALDANALRDEAERLIQRASDETVEVRYNEARLRELERRQDYAIERVRDSGAVVEVCPTSNRRIGGIADPAHHPVHRFVEKDLPFVVSSDDPGIFGTTLREEIEWVVRAANLGEGMADELARRSWRYRSEVLTGRESN